MWPSMPNSWPCRGGGEVVSAVCDLAIAAPNVTASTATRNRKRIDFIRLSLLALKTGSFLGTWDSFRTLIETRLAGKSGKKSVNASKVLSKRKPKQHKGLTILYR